MEKSSINKFFALALLACALVILFFIVQPFRNWVRATSAYWILADNVVTPLLRTLDPEQAHDLSLAIMNKELGPLDNKVDPKILHLSLWGKEFANPIGIAAGYDKQAQAMQGLLDMGFGFVEVGGVTPNQQDGNEKPRMFRLTEDRAVINRYGLNSAGHAEVMPRLREFNSKKTSGIVGVNIAKNTNSDDALADYRLGIKNLGDTVDFIVLNVSCPNVAWTKQLSGDSDAMRDLVCAIRSERDMLSKTRPPLLIKLGPDMDQAEKEHMAHIALNCGVDGIVVANTTSTRPNNLISKHRAEQGGLSGKPVKNLALQTTRDMYRLTAGTLPIISVGGIESGKDAYDRIRAGASLVQIYSALVYSGPGLVPSVKNDLAFLLEKDGFVSVADAVGADNQQN